jgi:hypothetical protein
MAREINSFTEFWPFYVGEHSKSMTRIFHFIGMSAAMISLVALIATGRWFLFPIAFVPGYAMAWIAHFFIEHNRPATFKYPVWSFVADYKMVGFMLIGRMGSEVEKLKSQAR